MYELTSIKLVDICFSDYLTDHHNRDGELLIGVYLNGQSAERMALDVVFMINGTDEVPEEISDYDIKESLIWWLVGVGDCKSPLPEFKPVPCEENCPIDACECEQPSAWFLIQWRRK